METVLDIIHVVVLRRLQLRHFEKCGCTEPEYWWTRFYGQTIC